MAHSYVLSLGPACKTQVEEKSVWKFYDNVSDDHYHTDSYLASVMKLAVQYCGVQYGVTL